MSSKMADRLKMLAIVAMGLTAAFTLLGGVGTGCIAYSADQYGVRFAVYVPSMPLYQVFVYVGVGLGTAGAVVTYALVRGHKWAYRGALITLGIGAVMALVHNIHSSWLNEDSFAEYLMNMPTSMRLYITVITLVLFLILRLPSIRKKVDVDFTTPWRGKGSGSAGGGLAAIVAGITTITTPIWVGGSHLLQGYNLVNVLRVPLMVGGGLMILVGVILMIPVLLETSRKQAILRLYRKLRYPFQERTNTG